MGREYLIFIIQLGFLIVKIRFIFFVGEELFRQIFLKLGKECLILGKEIVLFLLIVYVLSGV